MLRSKLHNPVIANGSYIENLVVEKINTDSEKKFYDEANNVLPEEGRVWFNTDDNEFRFSNLGEDGKVYIDKFLSKTDTREQVVNPSVKFLNVFNIVKEVTDDNGNTSEVKLFSIDKNAGLAQINIDTISSVSNKINTVVNEENKVVGSALTIKDNDGNTKFQVDQISNKVSINSDEFEVTANTVSLNGNLYVSGNLNVVGETTRVTIESEVLAVADNMIELNSNLTEDDDPRVVSNIVDGEDTDRNAGLIVNRGKAGKLPLIEWVESTDTSTDETLNDAVAKVSIYNRENGAYELHQIIDEYTLGREVENVSGSSWVGYDGHEGQHYSELIADDGSNESEISQYTFKLEAGKLDNTLDKVVDEIDNIKFNTFDGVRVAETSQAGKVFTIKHNLGTEYVDVRIQRQLDDGTWMFDIAPIQILDENTIKVEYTEEVKLRIMIEKLNGFVIPQENITIA
jgi:hypothetical protein